MYLEKLEIQGFKSFANKNKLLFSGFLNDKKRGITVIVGPNGSGKSNITDAVRWVLGEQSSKLLRSKKNEDVIFSGSNKKGRLNMAEVSLFLNNEKRGEIFNKKEEEFILEDSEENRGEFDNLDALLLLPEIIITRRVFRTGLSEYFINNTKVRLSDIQIFLAKANFGQKTYSVIGQGMVENFLNTSPAERKAFFDEATGVKQYQIKRDLSLNRLESSQENLLKVEMLLNEIEPRLKSLTRQVNKLKKRRFLEEDLRRCQLNYYGKNWQEINFNLGAWRLKIIELEKDKEEMEKNLNFNKDKIKEKEELALPVNDYYDLQKKILLLEKEIEDFDKQLEKISSWENLQKNLSNDLDKQNLEKREEERNVLLEKIKKDSEGLEVLRKDEAGDNLEQTEEELRAIIQERQEQFQFLARIEARIEARLERQGKFDLSFLLKQVSEQKKKLQELKENIKEVEGEIEDQEKNLEKQEKEKQILSNNIKDLEKELERINLEEHPNNLEQINKNLKTILEKTEKQYSTLSLESFKKIIEEIREDLKKIINFSSGYDYDYLLETVNKKIKKLKEEEGALNKNNLSLQVSLALNKDKKKNWEDAFLKTERDIKENEQKINSYQEESDLGDEKEKSKIEESIKQINLNFIEKNNQIQELRLRLDQREREVKQKEKLLQENQGDLNNLNNEINNLKIALLKNNSRLEELEGDILTNLFYNKEKKDLNLSEEILGKEKDFLRELKENKKEEITGLYFKVNNFNQEQEKRKKTILDLQKNISDQERTLFQVNETLNNHKISLAREETRLEEVENNISSDQIDLRKIKEHQVEEGFNLEQLRGEIARFKSQLEQIGGIDPETEKEYEEAQKRFSFLFEQTEDLNKTIRSLEGVISELDIIIKDRFETEFKIISEKFNEYFKILFNGGQAKIFPIKEESFSDKNNKEGEEEKDLNFLEKNPLSYKNSKMIKRLKKYSAIGLSGIDISATPPGKKISSVNMLSGGERALTAIALICAIISANPAPFVVLDEVDASLDEANSERLAKILDDLSNRTQFIVVSHNRATMRRANILYGVTMEDDGVSKLLSVKMDEKLK